MPSSTPTAPGSGTPAHDRPTPQTSAMGQVAAAVKPRLRGWIHAGMTPLVVVAVVVLIALTPPVAPRVSTLVFGISAVLLFGTSAVYHRGTWSPRVTGVLRRMDHTNIFLIIAGSYTPLAVLLLEKSVAQTLLIIVWAGAVLGLLARVFWLGAPRWFYVPIYLALGWVAVAFLPQFWRSGGPTVVWLIMIGGLAYSVGAVVYGLKRPNPSPRWFGFHEIFHSLTVVGWGCHFAAVAVAVAGLR